MPYFRLFSVVDDFGTVVRVLRVPYGIMLHPTE